MTIAGTATSASQSRLFDGVMLIHQIVTTTIKIVTVATVQRNDSQMIEAIASTMTDADAAARNPSEARLP
jgi:hypothetical protein